jgi:hypothetical protein
VELHAPPQVQLDLTHIAAQLPALGEHRLRLPVLVVGREAVVREPGVLRRGVLIEVWLEVDDVANLADA